MNDKLLFFIKAIYRVHFKCYNFYQLYNAPASRCSYVNKASAAEVGKLNILHCMYQRTPLMVPASIFL